MRRRAESGSGSAGDGESPIPERIRNRRARLGLTGVELAKLIGVSPSYVSLIESGAKVPSPSVAAALAAALGDDPELYEAWVHSARQGGWRRALRSSRYWSRYSTDPAMLRRVARGEDLRRLAPGGDVEKVEEDGESYAELALPTAFRDPRELHAVELPAPAAAEGPRAAQSPRAFTLVEIPILEDGADPGREPRVDETHVIDTLVLDSRLFSGSALVRPFAYRPAEAALDRVSDRIRPGDHVVLDSGPPRLRPEAILAVRFRDRVVLSRVLSKKTALILLPGEDSDEFEVLELDGHEALERIVAGHVVLTLRAG